MKKLTTKATWFGPFKVIETTDNAYICDGCVLPFDVIGKGVISDYNPAVDVRPRPEAEIEAQWAAVRADRNDRLAACDWTQLPDAPVDAAVWATYRQALRDVTKQADPFNIVWPEMPA